MGFLGVLSRLMPLISLNIYFAILLSQVSLAADHSPGNRLIGNIQSTRSLDWEKRNIRVLYVAPGQRYEIFDKGQARIIEVLFTRSNNSLLQGAAMDQERRARGNVER